jgi:hypothetical protein
MFKNRTPIIAQPILTAFQSIWAVNPALITSVPNFLQKNRYRERGGIFYRKNDKDLGPEVGFGAEA